MLVSDKGIEGVPVWSPEVRFIFSTTPEEADRQLRAVGIGSGALDINSLNTNYLISKFPLYAALPPEMARAGPS
jgi:hypothetical protein